MKDKLNGYGWVVVASVFAIGFITDGLMFSFGILMVDLLAKFRWERAGTAAIISVTMGMCHLSGPFTGALCEKFGHRFVVVVGSVVASVGFVISTFADSVLHIISSYGILGGFGFGMMYLSGRICVLQTSTKHRSLAAGISACGSGVGNVCFTHLTRYLIDCYGWRGAVLIEAAIILHGLLCALLLVNPPRKSSNTSIQGMSTQFHSPKEKESISSDGYRHESDGDNLGHIDTGLDKSTDIEKVNDGEQTNCLTTFFRSMFSLKLMKDKVCWLFLLSTFMYQLAFTIPITLLPDQGSEAGMTKEETSWLISSIGISNMVGRVSLGWMGDKVGARRIILLDIIVLVAGLVTGVSALLSTFVLKLIYTSLFGFLTGGYVTLINVVLVDIFGVEMISKSFGILMVSVGISSLISTPFAGWLFDKTGTYILTFVVAGVEFMLSGFCLMGLQYFKQRSHRMKAPSSVDKSGRSSELQPLSKHHLAPKFHD